MTDNSRKVTAKEYDGLITDVNPPVQVHGRTIARQTTARTYKRGTVFARSQNNQMLYILGTTAAAGDTLVPDCVLCDDTAAAANADNAAAVYTAGCFDPDKVTAAAGYTITEGDLDELRKRGIVFKAAHVAR
jgi:hypothetical protein